MSAPLPGCDEDVFKNGISLGMFDMPKEQAEAMCIALTKDTGIKHDWHYIGGRVHMKRARPAEPEKPKYESPWA